jgi:cytochrome P450
MATDIIGELSFGDSFRMLEIGTKNQYIADLETVAKIGGIRATFPFVMAVAGILPLSIFREVVESTDRIVSYAMQSVERYKAHLALNPDEAGRKPTLFTKLYGASQGESQKNGEECLSDREIRNDAQSFIIAGSDTTANTLTYLVWSVLRDENIQRKLVAELEESLGGTEKELSDSELRELPYLNQVISEALRLYPAVPSALPRVVPEKGSTLAGYWLPGGATVTTQLYSLHRDAEIFEDPERQDPHQDQYTSQANYEKIRPLPLGIAQQRDEGRVYAIRCRIAQYAHSHNTSCWRALANICLTDCVGIHLARMELRLATASFFRAFPTATVSTKENMSDADMEQTLHFLLSPKGKRCLVEV